MAVAASQGLKFVLTYKLSKRAGWPLLLEDFLAFPQILFVGYGHVVFQRLTYPSWRFQTMMSGKWSNTPIPLIITASTRLADLKLIAETDNLEIVFKQPKTNLYSFSITVTLSAIHLQTTIKLRVRAQHLLRTRAWPKLGTELNYGFKVWKERRDLSFSLLWNLYHTPLSVSYL